MILDEDWNKGNDVYTVKEVSVRACPLSFFLGEDYDVCRGDVCMAWRWHDVVAGFHEVITLEEGEPLPDDWGNPFERVPNDSGDSLPRVFARYVPERRRGFCGLAGRVKVSCDQI
jgi:hypothetical protein